MCLLRKQSLSYSCRTICCIRLREEPSRIVSEGAYVRAGEPVSHKPAQTNKPIVGKVLCCKTYFFCIYISCAHDKSIGICHIIANVCNNYAVCCDACVAAGCFAEVYAQLPATVCPVCKLSATVGEISVSKLV